MKEHGFGHSYVGIECFFILRKKAEDFPCKAGIRFNISSQTLLFNHLCSRSMTETLFKSHCCLVLFFITSAIGDI